MISKRLKACAVAKGPYNEEKFGVAKTFSSTRKLVLYPLVEVEQRSNNVNQVILIADDSKVYQTLKRQCALLWQVIETQTCNSKH